MLMFSLAYICGVYPSLFPSFGLNKAYLYLISYPTHFLCIYDIICFPKYICHNEVKGTETVHTLDKEKVARHTPADLQCCQPMCCLYSFEVIVH